MRYLTIGHCIFYNISGRRATNVGGRETFIRRVLRNKRYFIRNSNNNNLCILLRNFIRIIYVYMFVIRASDRYSARGFFFLVD